MFLPGQRRPNPLRTPAACRDRECGGLARLRMERAGRRGRPRCSAGPVARARPQPSAPGSLHPARGSHRQAVRAGLHPVRGSAPGAGVCTRLGAESAGCAGRSAPGAAGLHPVRGSAPGAGAESAGCAGRSAPGAAGLHPVRGSAPGAGAESAGCAGKSAPGAAGLHPVRGSAPGAGAESAGSRAGSAPGSGVCTRHGGGIGRIGAQNPRLGCKPPNRVHSCRPGGVLSPRPGCKPPQRVHSRCTGGGALSAPPHGSPTPAGSATASHRPKQYTLHRDEPLLHPYGGFELVRSYPKTTRHDTLQACSPGRSTHWSSVAVKPVLPPDTNCPDAASST